MAHDASIDVIDVLAGAIYEGDGNASAGMTWARLKASAANEGPGYTGTSLLVEPSTNKVDKYRRIAQEALDALGEAWTSPEHDKDDPDTGHRFKISVTTAGSHSTVGDKHHTDSDFSEDVPPWGMTVRAWNLRDALLIGAAIPFSHWAENFTRAVEEREAQEEAHLRYDHPPYDYASDETGGIPTGSRQDFTGPGTGIESQDER